MRFGGIVPDPNGVIIDSLQEHPQNSFCGMTIPQFRTVRPLPGLYKVIVKSVANDQRIVSD